MYKRQALVPFLGVALGDNVEIALHDLTSPEQEVVAIANGEICLLYTSKECKIVDISMITVGKLISACDEVILCNKTNSNTEGRITSVSYTHLQ